MEANKATGILNWRQPMRLTGAEARKVNEMCWRCHQTDNYLATWQTSVHNVSSMACISCHDVHRPDSRKLLRLPISPGASGSRKQGVPSAPLDFASEPTELCLQCHRSQRVQALMPSHHPMREGRMSCISCHEPHGRPRDGLKEITINEMCARCHRDKTGPFVFEHAPSTTDCSICHRPHGSVNQRLLRQPEPTMCLKCHRAIHMGWTREADFPTRLGRNLAYLRCSNCHQPHGSDRSVNLTY